MKSLPKYLVMGALGFMLVTGGLSLVGAETVGMNLTPDDALSGATVQAGGAYPMTLSVTGTPESIYDVATESEGGVGECATATGSLTTDATGAGSWLCEFTAAAEAATGAVTFRLSKDGSELGYLRALLTVEASTTEQDPAEEETGDGDTETGGDDRADNHGGCVSWWAHRAKAEGLRGRWFGGFVSGIAKSDCTTSTREDERYTQALADALAAQAEALEGTSGTTSKTSTSKGHGRGKKAKD